MAHAARCAVLVALVSLLAATSLLRAAPGGPSGPSGAGEPPGEPPAQGSGLGERAFAPGTFDPLRPPLPQPFAADPYEAAQDGIDWLVAALCNWMQGPGRQADCSTGGTQTCFGCHVQAETILGLARSAERCYQLPDTPCALPGDESPIEFAARFVAGSQRKACILGPFSPSCAAIGIVPVDPSTVDGQWAELGSIGHYPDCGSNAPPASIHPVIQSAHGGLNLAGYTRWVSIAYRSNLVALADWFVGRQQPDGRLIPDRFEAPVDQGESFCTAAAVMVMAEARRFSGPAQFAAYQAGIAAGRTWTASAAHQTTQDWSFAILTLLEAGADPSDPDLIRLRDTLLGQQLPDGGWAERAGLQSNAYATGQAVNALIEAGVAIDELAICSGVGWLVDNQNLDGSWNLGTPGVETDATRDESFTATIWPVIALGNLRPFGAAIQVASAARVTCDDYVVFPVEVKHAADTACGLFARSDTFELSVVNGAGDSVWVEPASLDLGGGGSAVVLVHWRRNGPLPPPGTGSVTALNIDSVGARGTGCPVLVRATLTVVVPSDAPPEALDDSLRVARQGRDLELSWEPLPEELGRYEIVTSQRVRRGDALPRPSRVLLDSSRPIARSELGERALRLDGEGGLGGPTLRYYKVRATSPCTSQPGPTCGLDCGDPERCDVWCP